MTLALHPLAEIFPPIARKRQHSRVFGNRHLVWRGEKLCLGSKALVAILPDVQYPGMWRVRSGGALSDMVNLSRARDAARGFALCLLNKADREERGVAASPMRKNGWEAA
jgi:hypothetical protein